MDPKQLQGYLDDPETASEWMHDIGIADHRKGIRNIAGIAATDPSLEVIGPFIDHLSPLLRWTADPDMVLNNLERFFNATRTPLTLVSLLTRDRMALPMLLEIFATSQYLGDMLIGEPELFETIRNSDGLPKSQRQLTDELVEEVMALEKDLSVLNALRRFKRRETLRLAFGDIIKKQSLEVVTRQVSKVAQAVIEAAIHAAGRKLFRKYGTPLSKEGQMAHFTVIALGKLGGCELNYSSDIDLMFLYDQEGRTDPADQPIDNSRYFSELGREIVRLLTEPTELGVAYRVDMRLRPDGKHAPLAIGFDEALRYYDNRGRTWERQAFIKGRPVAGNLQLGAEFLRRLEPWIYRRSLTQADIAGVRTLKRRIERKSREAGDELLNVKTGYGGIRDIEFMTQFLQLLHGGELPELRIGNTLRAIDALEKGGCLQPQEKDLMVEGYRFLRKIEHRLQIMFDLQTHAMPENSIERRKLALRMGYNDMTWRTALDAFNDDFKYITEANRRMLNHLLIHAFSDDGQTAAEVDLLLDREPNEERIQQVLEKYRFGDISRAYRLLNDLMDEKNPYLSARRCRHFLVAISPQLLRAVSATPKPDETLQTLATVADALGEKGGLWELFSHNTPSLDLFVRLCALTPFLTDMLKSDPGMLDGLMDSLVLNRFVERDVLDKTLSELCVRAEQIEPILAGFKHDRLLHVGTRELLGRSPIQETTAAISDIAQGCLTQLMISECNRLVQKHGTPFLDQLPAWERSIRSEENERKLAETESPSEGDLFYPCRFVAVALGKFGGREMNYRSDLDLLFLFSGEGRTKPFAYDEKGNLYRMTPTNGSISNQDFFNRLVQAVIKKTTAFGPWGKLYDIDLRLRPMGKNGPLAVSLAAFWDYFNDGTGQLWERQMLCKARIVFNTTQLVPLKKRRGPTNIVRYTKEVIGKIRFDHQFHDGWKNEIRHMRKRLLESDSQDQLKRGAGGTVDVEFIVQMLQLQYGRSRPGICVSNTFNAIERLHAAGILDADDYCILRDGYRFLRMMESALCLLNHQSAKRIPNDPMEREKLAMLLGYESAEELLNIFETTTSSVADCFNRFFDVGYSEYQ